MGRATNELGYLPRALLVRQLSRIACVIPHFLYLPYVITPSKPLTYPHCFLVHQFQTLQVVHFAILQYETIYGHEMTLERRPYMSYLDSQSLVL